MEATHWSACQCVLCKTNFLSKTPLFSLSTLNLLNKRPMLHSLIKLTTVSAPTSLHFFHIINNKAQIKDEGHFYCIREELLSFLHEQISHNKTSCSIENRDATLRSELREVKSCILRLLLDVCVRGFVFPHGANLWDV